MPISDGSFILKSSSDSYFGFFVTAFAGKLPGAPPGLNSFMPRFCSSWKTYGLDNPCPETCYGTDQYFPMLQPDCYNDTRCVPTAARWNSTGGKVKPFTFGD